MVYILLFLLSIMLYCISVKLGHYLYCLQYGRFCVFEPPWAPFGAHFRQFCWLAVKYLTVGYILLCLRSINFYYISVKLGNSTFIIAFYMAILYFWPLTFISIWGPFSISFMSCSQINMSLWCISYFVCILSTCIIFCWS